MTTMCNPNSMLKLQPSGIFALAKMLWLQSSSITINVWASILRGRSHPVLPLAMPGGTNGVLYISLSSPLEFSQESLRNPFMQICGSHFDCNFCCAASHKQPPVPSYLFITANRFRAGLLVCSRQRQLPHSKASCRENSSTTQWT